VIVIKCVGNRYLDITKRSDGQYEVRIMLHRGKRELRLATLVLSSEEFAKLRDIS